MAKANGSYDRESGTKALHLVSVSEHHRFSASESADKSNEITAIPALLSCLTWQVVLSHSMRWGLKKVLLIRFIPQVQIIFSVLNQIIPRCFNRWNSGFSKCRRMPLPTPREHTTESGHHRHTHRLDTLGGLFAAPIKQTRGQDCKVLSSWNGLVGYGTKPPTKCSSTSAVCRIAPNCRCHSPALGIENGLHWILDVTFGEDACRVRSPCTPQSGTASLCRQCAQSSRLKQTKPQAEV